MIKKCDSYRIESKKEYTYHPITGKPIRHDTMIGVCWGTKEIDECSCGGDRTKCDFYPEVRDKAKSELEYEKVVTNADYIRSMNDEKLAECLVDIGWDCHLCSEDERLSDSPLLKNKRCDEQCTKHCLEWLKKKSK